MPIKGLTDRHEVSFPKIGDVRKGAPKNDQGHVGKDLTYFRAEFVEGEEAAAERYEAAFGKQPRELYVMLPFRSIDRNWEAWQEAYTAGQLLHRCDGETCVLWYDTQSKEYRTDPKACPGGCVPTGRLKVLIPELRRLAYVEIHTTSINDILEITRNLEALQQLTGNGINGIPLVLKRRPREISTPSGKDGKRARREKWLLSIEADPDWVERQIGAMKAAALPSGGEPLALPEPVEASFREVVSDLYVNPDPDVPEEGTFEPEPEPPPAPHWSEMKVNTPAGVMTVGDKLWIWATATMNLKDAEIWSALGVETLTDFAGTAQDARNAIEAYITEQMAKAEAAQNGQLFE